MCITRNETSAPYGSSGDPHYLFDREGFGQNIDELLEAFLSRYGNFSLAYSFKTNYLKDACDAVNERGGLAEVVSPQEYSYASVLGFPESRIVYNGVIPDDGKLAVLAGGGMVNIDSLAEYERLAWLAQELSTPISIGVRVNLDVPWATSRFGIPPEGDDFAAIMERISQNGFVSLGGFHSHVHGGRDVRCWVERAEALIDLAKRYGARYIDLGGGMWGKMPEELKAQFKSRPNTYQEYGEAVGGLFANAFPDESVKLVVEPGIGLVGSAMECASHVVGIKEIRGKQYVQLDINGAATAFDYNCDANRIRKPFHIIRTGTGQPVGLLNADLVGTTCTEIDVLVRDYCGVLAVGDTIVFENIGAYSLVTSRQFITPRLGVYDSRTKECLREPECFGDMFAKYLRET